MFENEIDFNEFPVTGDDQREAECPLFIIFFH
jgi:hypothetical protein